MIKIKKDLLKLTHLSPYIINKLNRGDNVNKDSLVRINTILNCQLEDIIELEKDIKNIIEMLK